MREGWARGFVAVAIVVGLVGAACGSSSDDAAPAAAKDASDAEVQSKADRAQPAEVDAAAFEPTDDQPVAGAPNYQPEGAAKPPKKKLRKLVAQLPARPNVGGRPPSGRSKAPRGGSTGWVDYYGHLPGYKGTFTQVFQYSNYSGIQTKVNCGQAAAATMLTFVGAYPVPDMSGDYGYKMRAIEYAYPPDVLWGAFGTSAWRMADMLRKEAPSHNFYEYTGVANLRKFVGWGYPAIVLLDMGPLTGEFGAHWVMVFGYDNNNYYVTNYDFAGSPPNVIPKAKFEAAWNGNIPWWTGMGRRAYMLWK